MTTVGTELVGRPGRIAPGLVIVLVVAACSRQPPGDRLQRPSAFHPVQGCWSVEVVARGARLDSIRGWLSPGSLPTVLRLDTVRAERATDELEIFRARSYFDGRPEGGPFSAWRWLAADSILVERPGAMAGITLRMVRADSLLTGVLTSFTDVMEPGRPTRRTAPVRASSASCPPEGSGAGPSSAG